MAGSHDDEFLGDASKGRSGGVLGDMMKKALFATVGAVFMTEESVRAYVSESKLPRDVKNYIVQNTAQAKEQFFGYMAKEISQLVRKSDLPKALKSFLADHTIEVEAKIRFKSNGMPEITSAAKAAPNEPREPTPPFTADSGERDAAP